jgi:hypothetical protein
LVAGGGFVPQSLIDSVQLTDSTMVRNAKKGYKGKFVIQFSFSFLISSQELACCPLLRRSFRDGYRRESTGSDGKLLKLRNTDGYLKRFQEWIVTVRGS